MSVLGEAGRATNAITASNRNHRRRVILATRHICTNETLSEYLTRWSIPEPNSGCWLWLGSVKPKGYGAARWQRRNYRAHRLAWLERHGAIPAGLFVCHRCDVPACINPDHLFLGTHDENMADMVAKERQAKGAVHAKATNLSNLQRGTNNRSAKLTEGAVRAIRSSSLSLKALAREFGVSKQAISAVRKGVTWSHV
jgi:DNA-binding transcriptional regulator YiaG